MPQQNCLVCAWRENCSKRFCIPDNGARCPDFTRDVSIKDAADDDKTTDQKEHLKK